MIRIYKSAQIRCDILQSVGQSVSQSLSLSHQSRRVGSRSLVVRDLGSFHNHAAFFVVFVKADAQSLRGAVFAPFCSFGFGDPVKSSACDEC